MRELVVAKGNATKILGVTPDVQKHDARHHKQQDKSAQ